MQKVAILDYGSSNIRSVAKALEHVAGKDAEVLITDQPKQLLGADRVVFPGQGAIGQCMDRLLEKGFSEALRESIATKPFLGLCLGLQSLLDESEEDGGVRGLSLIPGKVRRFPGNKKDSTGKVYKIPHMGWNAVQQEKPHPLWQGIASGERFYFVHSYYVAAERGEDLAGTTHYILDFASAMARDKLFAVQFHPEKSQAAGLRLLENFLAWRV